MGGMPGSVPGAPQMAAGDAGNEVGRRGQHAYKAFVQSTGHGKLGQVCPVIKLLNARSHFNNHQC